MNTSRKIIVGNWKSNLSWKQAQDWAKSFAAVREHDYEYVICPPFPLLGALQNETFSLGIQDLSQYESGAYTGAVSAQNLDGLNVEYVILGHSERRVFFGETSQTVAQKVDLALAHGLTPIVCVDKKEFESQAAALGDNAAKCFIAYEPVHAISTFGGQEDPLEVTLEAVAQIERLFSPLGILYGGSVSPENSFSYIQQPNLAGVLVGGSSLKPEVFAKL